METILDKIIAEKRKTLPELKQKISVIDMNHDRKANSFIAHLEQAEELAIIAEFKRASPSKGNINTDLDPAKQAASYVEYGANAVSVLTDTPFFKGTFSDLETVRSSINKPILCKDFMIDTVQIDIAKYSGADIILLIVAALKEEKLNELYQYAIKSGLEVLMEVHDEEELTIALRTGAKLIGVNNRNLKTFEVDLNVTERLAPTVKEAGAYLISESGIKTLDDVKRVVAAGANGILVGETFMTSENLEQTLKEMKLPVNGGDRL
jgi:indole-3-glycerol phosphate synthase